MRAEKARWVRGELALGILAATSLLSGCVHVPRWEILRGISPDLVTQALEGPGVMSQELGPENVPVLPVRVHLRPCCAFGTHLTASLGPVPIPLFSMGNIRSVDELGPHKYDSGALSIEGSSKKNAFTRENNGLVYTCRGGFIDTAHVRDYADWTVFWATTIARLSVTGGTVEPPPEGGTRRVIIRPLPARIVERYGLRRSAIALAQWLAFQFSIWHEIAQTYGFASVEVYPEYVSAFSPEDLYSNLLGIKIAGSMLMQTGSIATDSLYDQNMDRWLQATLQYLEPVRRGAGAEAMYLVDGVWWNSKARLPDFHLVTRRNLDAGLAITPWQISRAYSSPKMTAWVDKECGGSERPLVLRRAESADGIQFADVVTLAINVDVKDRFPFPRAGSTQITQADFPAIIEAARTRAIRMLGPGTDQPARKVPAAS